MFFENVLLGALLDSKEMDAIIVVPCPLFLRAVITL